MSINPKKSSILGAFILLVVCTATMSAQTPAGPDLSSVKKVLVKETKEEKPLVPKTRGAVVSTDPNETSTVGNSVNTDANTTVTVPGPEAAPNAKTNTVLPKPQTDSTDEWQFQFSPYFWLAGLHGIGGVANRTASVEMSFGDVFDTLNFAFMGTFEARKGRFVSLTDLEYVSVSDDRATPGPLFSSVDAGFKTFIFDQEFGYRLFDDPAKGASLDVLGGARVWRVKTDFEFGAGILPATRIEASRSWVDAVGGLRGKMALSEKVFLTGKFDLGGGGSQFTWQVFAGGGYALNPNIALIFGYRVLDVDYNKDNFIYDMNQRGPIMGIGFRF